MPIKGATVLLPNKSDIDRVIKYYIMGSMVNTRSFFRDTFWPRFLGFRVWGYLDQMT